MGVFDGEAYLVDIRDASGDETRGFTDTAQEAQQLLDEARDDGARAGSASHIHYVRSEVDTGLAFGDWWDDE